MTERDRRDKPPEETALSPDPDGALLASATDADGEPIDFMTLAHGRREILVRLAGQTYRLRWTRNDKLILTK